MNDLIDSLFIVAVFSFVTMGVNAITDSISVKLVIYFILFTLTFLQKKGR